jgi:small subunit ribosomal protein S17
MEFETNSGRQRKRLTGEVISNKMDKTVVVVVTNTRRHPLYGKVIRVSKNYKAHDEDNACKIGDRVRIVESRPYSKDTHFRVETILTSSAQIDTAPLQAAGQQAKG